MAPNKPGGGKKPRRSLLGTKRPRPPRPKVEDVPEPGAIKATAAPDTKPKVRELHDAPTPAMLQPRQRTAEDNPSIPTALLEKDDVFEAVRDELEKWKNSATRDEQKAIDAAVDRMEEPD